VAIFSAFAKVLPVRADCFLAPLVAMTDMSKAQLNSNLSGWFGNNIRFRLRVLGIMFCAVQIVTIIVDVVTVPVIQI
jgi:hypothetical protein